MKNAMKGIFTVLLLAAMTATVFAEPAFDLRSRTSHPPLNDKEAYVQWMLQHTTEEESQIRARWDRMQQDIVWYNDQPSELIECFLRTPREYFARDYNAERAYVNDALHIESNQTISGPHIQIRMTLAIMPEPDMKVLEIGTGSGNQAAMLAQLSNHVYSIEIKEGVFNVTEDIFEELRDEYPEYNNIHTVHADGYYGWKEEYGWDEEGPIEFDRIIVTCGIDHIPPALLNQLKPDGIMIIPVGTRYDQAVMKITKRVDADGVITMEREDIYGGRLRSRTIFVPFTNEEGGVHARRW